MRVAKEKRRELRWREESVGLIDCVRLGADIRDARRMRSELVTLEQRIEDDLRRVKVVSDGPDLRKVGRLTEASGRLLGGGCTAQTERA